MNVILQWLVLIVCLCCPLVGSNYTVFRDFSKISRSVRVPKSPVMQFYSSANNIGNYIPVLGIQEMLGFETDTWCIHDKNIDFDFINKNYSCVIIGGAGLLHRCFDSFWKAFAEKCTLPAIVWGVGICLPHKSKQGGANKEFVKKAFAKCDLINLRDELTAKYYDVVDASITPCPSIKYLQRFRVRRPTTSQALLYAHHQDLVPKEFLGNMKSYCAKYKDTLHITRNALIKETSKKSVAAFIRDNYVNQSLVISTRLHGAIIAYGLGIPYVCLSFDDKVAAFHEHFGNGVLVSDLAKLSGAIDTLLSKTASYEPALKGVEEFGASARSWVLNKIYGNKCKMA